MTTSPAAAASGAGNDRRTADRRPLRARAFVTLPGQQRFEVRTLDLSHGGLSIVGGANPQPGAAFEIEFALPLRPSGQMPLKLQVRVVHSVFSAAEDGFKIGLHFVRLPADVAAAIAKFMK